MNSQFANRLSLTLAALVLVAFGMLFSNNRLVAQSVGLGNVAGVVQVNNNDPCLSPSVSKYSAPVSITTATATELAAAVVNKTVYACGFKASSGAAQTLQFETGTVTACGTPVVKTGAFALSGATNPTEFLTANMNSFQSAKGGDVCVVTTTTGSVQGVFVYVQQ